MSTAPALLRSRVARGLHAWVPLLLVVALVLILFRDTVAAMVAIWSRSDTFAHAFLVPPISLWLMWRLRGPVSALPVRGAPAWLVPMAAACLLWLLGRLAGVAAAAQFAVVAMLVLSVPVVLGNAVAWRLAFPLSFLFFSVPIGEFLVEPMMEGTADFTVLALRLSGIPVYREGLQFVIPSGNWSVVEACSGVRYLIASFMVGTLFAYLNYRSRKRQLLFMLVSLVVPVVANWLRAYMIVMLGHLSGNKLAVGADHLIYGWVFFGVVILIMFTVGARFAEHDDEVPKSTPSARSGTRSDAVGRGGTDRQAVWLTASMAALLLLATQAALWQLNRPVDGGASRLVLPALLPGGWVAGEEPLTAWTPRYQNARSVDTRTYRQGDAAVGVWIAHYRDQGFQRKMITSTNMLIQQGSIDWLPMPVAPTSLRSGAAGSREVQLRATLLRAPADPKVNPRQRLWVLQVYRVAGTYEAGDARAQLRLALGRLLGRGDDSAVLMFYAEVDEGSRGSETLERFVAEQLPTFAAVVDGASARP